MSSDRSRIVQAGMSPMDCSVLENMPIAVMILDLHDQAIGANKQWLQLTGRSVEFCLGVGWHNIFSEWDRDWVLEEIPLAREQGRELSTDFRIETPDGSQHMVHGRCAPLSDETATLLGYLFTLEDTSDRVRMEDELRLVAERAEEANKAKSLFIANISHEIRTPLNGILGMSTLLMAEDTNPEIRQNLETVFGNAEALLGVINDILDFSSLESGHFLIETGRCQTHSLIDQPILMFTEQAQLRGLEIVPLVDARIPTVAIADSRRVRQVVGHLLSNAIKFSENGLVEVRMRQEFENEEDLLLTISVQDSGIGIAKDQLGMIFEHFSQVDTSSTREQGGTGLGLAVSKRVAMAMGGDLTVTSEEGRGTTFEFSIRLGLASQTSDTPPNQSVFSGRTILLVEDNPVNQMVTKRILEKLGCQVEVAPNGLDAVSRFEAEAPDLILMDCQMPCMDGFSATRAIRSAEGTDGHVPIIALTANATVEDRNNCMRSGMDDYLSKPIRIERIREKLETWLKPEF